MKKNISIIVCGKFHYGAYAWLLARDNRLAKIYFSHSLSTTFGLPPNQRKNLFAKEYLTALHVKLIGKQFLERVMPAYHLLWKIALNCVFHPTDVNIFLLHGNCTAAMAKAKQHGKLIIGEAVNCHPEQQQHQFAQSPATHTSLGLSTSDKRILRELRLVDYLLCPSSSVAQSYIERGFDAKRTWIIPYGIPTPFLNGGAPRAITFKGISRLVCVGQIIPRKGQHLILQALSKARSEKSIDVYDITFIGSSDPRYVRSLSKYEIDYKHIKHVPNCHILSTLCRFDVFLLASLEDGFAVAVVEAIAAGIPVIVSKFAGVSELLQDCDAAWIVDPFDADSIIKALSEIQSLKGTVKQPPKTLHSWESYSRMLCGQIDQIMAGATNV